MKATLTIGIPASGKTTWAESQQGVININRDDIRVSLFGTDYKFSKAKEAIVTDTQRTIIADAAKTKSDIIISDTNLNPAHRDNLVNFCMGLGYEIDFKEFPISYEEALKRDVKRANGVGQQVIYRMYKQWMEYIGCNIYKGNHELPNAVIFDVDGTLSYMVDRGPFDWDKVGGDQPRSLIVDMLNAYKLNNKIIIFSGRDSVCRELTEKWLFNNNIEYDALYMRDIGDMRKDTVVKEEIFWANIANNYNVVACVDDRPCIIRMWYSLGIPNVISVADPYIEF